MLDGDDGVGHAQRQVVVGVDADFGCAVEVLAHRVDPLGDVAHGHGAAGVHDIHAPGAVSLHQLGLFGQPLRGGHVAHHQESDGVHAHLAGGGDVVCRDVGFGAVRRDAHHAGTRPVRGGEIVDGSDSRQHQRCDLRALDDTGYCLNPFQVGVRAESVDAARPPEPVPVGDLDRVHPCRVQRGGDFGGLRQAVLVAYRVHPVTQRDVADVERLGHCGAPTLLIEWAAMRSAVASAAEVMMSRFPA